MINQYDVVLVNLEPSIGSEIKKTRPCVVVSPKEMNIHLKTVVIAPITSTLKNYPTRVPISFNEKEGRIAIDQIRTIDKRRIIKQLSTISGKIEKELKDIIYQTFVL